MSKQVAKNESLEVTILTNELSTRPINPDSYEVINTDIHPIMLEELRRSPFSQDVKDKFLSKYIEMNSYIFGEGDEKEFIQTQSSHPYIKWSINNVELSDKFNFHIVPQVTINGDFKYTGRRYGVKGNRKSHISSDIGIYSKPMNNILEQLDTCTYTCIDLFRWEDKMYQVHLDSNGLLGIPEIKFFEGARVYVACFPYLGDVPMFDGEKRVHHLNIWSSINKLYATQLGFTETTVACSNVFSNVFRITSKKRQKARKTQNYYVNSLDMSALLEDFAEMLRLKNEIYESFVHLDFSESEAHALILSIMGINLQEIIQTIIYKYYIIAPKLEGMNLEQLRELGLKKSNLKGLSLKKLHELALKFYNVKMIESFMGNANSISLDQITSELGGRTLGVYNRIIDALNVEQIRIGGDLNGWHIYNAITYYTTNLEELDLYQQFNATGRGKISFSTFNVLASAAVKKGFLNSEIFDTFLAATKK